jgi:hypothetical protein
MVGKQTLGKGVAFTFGCIPTAEVFARTIPVSGQNFSDTLNGKTALKVTVTIALVNKPEIPAKLI